MRLFEQNHATAVVKEEFGVLVQAAFSNQLQAPSSSHRLTWKSDWAEGKGEARTRRWFRCPASTRALSERAPEKNNYNVIQLIQVFRVLPPEYNLISHVLLVLVNQTIQI